MRLSNLQDTVFWARLEKASEFVLLSLLWVIISLPIITLPIATAALFAVHTNWAQGKTDEALERFFSALRQYAGKAILIGIGNAFGLGLVAANLTILPNMELPSVPYAFSVGVSLSVGWLIIAVNLYLWVLLPSVDLPLSKLVQIAIRLVFQHIIWTMGILLAIGIVVLASLWLLPAGIIVLALPSSLAWIVSRGGWRVIRSYEGQF